MKSVQLTGAALEAARSIANIMEATTVRCRELHAQYEAEAARLHQEADTATTALLKSLVVASGLDLANTQRPALDMRYLADHNIAFLIHDEEDDEADNGTHAVH